MAKTATVTLTYEFEYPDDFTTYEVESRAVDDFNEAIFGAMEQFGSEDLDIKIEEVK